MKKIIKEKALLKEMFQAIAYFVFIAGTIKLAIPELEGSSPLYKLGAFIVFFSLSILASCYAFFHVSSEITREYFPDFKTPIIDSDYKGVPITKIHQHPEILLWLAVSIPYFIIGIVIIGLGFAK